MDSRQDSINFSYLYLLDVADGLDVEISSHLRFERKASKKSAPFSIFLVPNQFISYDLTVSLKDLIIFLE